MAYSLANAHLKTKLTALTMFVCAITAFLLCSAFVVNDIINIRERLIEELSLAGDIIGERALSRLAFQQADRAEQDLTALQHKPSITQACIYNSDGSVFATYLAADMEGTCPKSPALGYHFTTNNLSLHQKISSSDNTIQGSIYIISDLREIYERLSRSLLLIFLIVTVVMAVAYVLAEKLQQIITTPLFGLLDATRAIAQHSDFSARAEKFYNDEIGELTDSFNKMMGQIQDANDNLEMKVKLRTQDLEREKIRAESANRAKSEFLRNMSHEFRTPLHAMNSFSLYGIKEADTAERSELHKYFSRIQSATSRLLKLIDGVLSLAKLESGQEAFVMEEGNLYIAMKAVLEESQSLLQDKNITIDMPEPDFPTTAYFDNDKIVQVITNITGNAIKFTPAGKSLIIRFSKSRLNDHPAISIAIADQGIGIPENELESIFEKFVQSSRTNTGAGGTGLGLSIARKIAEGHEGKITASNNAAGGACFTLTIPSDLEKGQRIVNLSSEEPLKEIA